MGLAASILKFGKKQTSSSITLYRNRLSGHRTAANRQHRTTCPVSLRGCWTVRDTVIGYSIKSGFELTYRTPHTLSSPLFIKCRKGMAGCFSFLFSFSLSAASGSLEAVGFMAVRYSVKKGFSPTFSPMFSFLR